MNYLTLVSAIGCAFFAGMHAESNDFRWAAVLGFVAATNLAAFVLRYMA